MDISKLYAELRSAGYTDEQALCKLKSDIAKEANEAAIAYEEEQKRKAKKEQNKTKAKEVKDEIYQMLCKYYSLKGLDNRSVRLAANAVTTAIDSFGNYTFYIL